MELPQRPWRLRHLRVPGARHHPAVAPLPHPPQQRQLPPQEQYPHEPRV